MKRFLTVSLSLMAAFFLWTVAVCFIDLQAIGPQGSSVGFATLNGFVHDLIGVNMTLYVITDWLGLVPIAFCMGFGVLGLMQLISRRSLLKVDRSLLVLGGFYVVVIAVFLLFEEFAINYRPVLIDGFLEASYPSSTTLLVSCVMPTAIMQFNARIKQGFLKKSVAFLVAIFIAFMLICRLVSGVHWLSDIIGGVLLSAGLVTAYYALAHKK